MMLRNLVLALVVANVVAWAWGQGALRDLGLPGPMAQAEPERMARQVRPELVRLDVVADGVAAQPVGVVQTEPEDEEGEGETAEVPLGLAFDAGEALDTPAEPEPEPEPGPEPEDVAADRVAAAPAPADEIRCLQMGPFEDGELKGLRAAAMTLPEGRWQIDTAELGSRWMAYLGPLASANAVRARRSELETRGIDVDRPGDALEPGLSLGRYATEVSAQRAVSELDRKGVQGVRVVLERPGRSMHTLRLPEADAALRTRVDVLGQTLGQTVRDCE